MFSERLKELRTEAGLSQKALATKLFISQQAVAGWELDKGSPNPEAMAKIAEILEVSADYLLGLTDQKEPPTPVSGDGQLSPTRQALLNEVEDMDEEAAKAAFDIIRSVKRLRGGQPVPPLPPSKTESP